MPVKVFESHLKSYRRIVDEIIEETKELQDKGNEIKRIKIYTYRPWYEQAQRKRPTYNKDESFLSAIAGAALHAVIENTREKTVGLIFYGRNKTRNPQPRIQVRMERFQYDSNLSAARSVDSTMSQLEVKNKEILEVNYDTYHTASDIEETTVCIFYYAKRRLTERDVVDAWKRKTPKKNDR